MTRHAPPPRDASDEEHWLDVLRGARPARQDNADDGLAALLRQAIQDNPPPVREMGISIAELEQRVFASARREGLTAPHESAQVETRATSSLTTWLAGALGQLFRGPALAVSLTLVLALGFVALMSSQSLTTLESDPVGLRGEWVSLPPIDTPRPGQAAQQLARALAQAGIAASLVEAEGAWRITFTVRRGQAAAARRIVGVDGQAIQEAGRYQLMLRPPE